MKKIPILFLFSALLSIPAYSQIRIGYMNPALAMSQMEEVAQVDQQVQDLLTKRDAQLVEKATALQSDFTEYEQGKAVLSAEVRAEREQALVARNQELEQEKEAYLNEVRQKRNELMTPIIERLNSAIEKIAEEMHLDLVLNEATSYGDAIVFYANEEKLNITSKVVQELKQQ